MQQPIDFLLKYNQILPRNKPIKKLFNQPILYIFIVGILVIVFIFSNLYDCSVRAVKLIIGAFPPAPQDPKKDPHGAIAPQEGKA